MLVTWDDFEHGRRSRTPESPLNSVLSLTTLGDRGGVQQAGGCTDTGVAQRSGDGLRVGIEIASSGRDSTVLVRLAQGRTSLPSHAELGGGGVGGGLGAAFGIGMGEGGCSLHEGDDVV